MNVVIATLASVFSGNTNVYLFLLIILSTSCIWAFGFAVNDVFDAEFDKKKDNTRNPISRGHIKKSDAFKVSIALAVVGIFSSFLLSFMSAFFFMLLFALFFLYSAEPFRLKEKYPFDIVFHSLFMLITFLAGYAAFRGIDTFSLLVSSLNLIPGAIGEILQEIRDHNADKLSGFSTSVMRIGVSKSIEAIKFLFVLEMFFSVYVAYAYFQRYFIILLSFVPFAKFLFFDNTKKGRYFDDAMRAANKCVAIFITILIILVLLNM